MAKGVEDCAFYRSTRLRRERGGRRPGPSDHDRPSSTNGGRAPPRVAARDDRDDDPRHQAQRGRPGPAGRARRDPRPGSRRSNAVRRPSRPPTRAPQPCSGRRSTVCGRPTAEPADRAGDCMRLPRRRCARPGTTPRGPTPTSGTRRRTRRARRASTAPRCRRAGRTPRPNDFPAGQQLWAMKLLGADRARRPGPLPGQRARGGPPRRPRQPQAGGLRRRRRSRSPTAPGDKLALTGASRSRLRRDRPELFTSYATLAPKARPPSHVVAFDRGGEVTLSTRLRSAWPRRAAGGTPPSRSPTAPGATCSPKGNTLVTFVVQTLLCHLPSPTLLVDRDAGVLRTASGGAADVVRCEVDGCACGSTSGRRARNGSSRVARGRRITWARTTGGIGWEAARREADYGYLLDDADRRYPTRVRDTSRTAYTDRRAPSTLTRSPGPTRLAGRPLAASCLRAARRHVHAGGHPRRRRRAPRPLVASASTWSSCCPSTRSTAPTTGGTTACSGPPRRGVRRPGGLPALRRRSPRRGLGVVLDVVHNHLGPSGNYLPDVRALSQPRPPTPGARWSTSTARAPPRCAASSSTAADVAHRLPRRRAAARRRARARRQLRRPPARAAGHRGRRAAAHLRRPLS